MLIYDVDKIEDLYKDFEKAKKDFINKEYDDFKSSYFYSCSDNVIVKLRNRIQTIYDNIQKGYDMIDKAWKEYIDDVGNYDKSIASGGNCGIHDGGVNSIVSQICSIDLYETAGVSTSFKSIKASALSIVSATGATVINLIFSILSGVAKFLEALFDGAVLIVGAIIGLGIVIGDGIASLIYKDQEKFAFTKKYFNGLLRFAGTDYMGTWKKKFYESNRFGIWLDEHAADSFKSTGGGYSFGEAIGYVAGVVILTVATLGIGTAATGGAAATSTAASTATSTATSFATRTVSIFGKKIVMSKFVTGTIAGIAATGKSEQKSYQAKVDDVIKEAKSRGINLDRDEVYLELSGKEMAQIYASASAQGVLEAWSFSATYGNGVKDWRMFSKATEKLAQKIGKDNAKKIVERTLKAGIAGGKEYAKAATQVIEGKEVDWVEVTDDALKSATISLIYDTSGLGNKIMNKGVKLFGRINNAKITEKAQEITVQNINASATNGIAGDTAEAVLTYSDEIAESTYKEAEEALINEFKKNHAIGIDALKKPIGTSIKNPMKDTASELGDYIMEEVA